MMSPYKKLRKLYVFVSLSVLCLGGATGFVLSSLDRIPIPIVALRWESRLERGAVYTPTGAAVPGEQVTLVYVGSLACSWANHPDVPAIVNAMKKELDFRVKRQGKEFRAVGIGFDRLAEHGLEHLARVGSFDEVMAGNAASNLGVQHFLYGHGNLAGSDATPQIIVISRSLKTSAGRIDVQNERVLLRLTGLETIREWASDGFPVTGVP